MTCTSIIHQYSYSAHKNSCAYSTSLGFVIGDTTSAHHGPSMPHTNTHNKCCSQVKLIGFSFLRNTGVNSVSINNPEPKQLFNQLERLHITRFSFNITKGHNHFSSTSVERNYYHNVLAMTHFSLPNLCVIKPSQAQLHQFPNALGNHKDKRIWMPAYSRIQVIDSLSIQLFNQMSTI